MKYINRCTTVFAVLLILLIGCSENDIIHYQSSGGVSLEFVHGIDGTDVIDWGDQFTAVLTITEEHNPDFDPIEKEITVERQIDGQDTSYAATASVEIPVGVFLFVDVLATIGGAEWSGVTTVEIQDDEVQTQPITLSANNRAPNSPTNPDPPNGSANVDTIFVDMFWDCTDPDGDPMTYSIDWGLTQAMLNNDTGLTTPGYILQMLPPGTYYWRVTAEDSVGAVRVGPTWNFTTLGAGGGGANNPPYEPSNPTPIHRELDVPWDIVFLEWDGGDPDNDPVTYDIYYGETQAMNNNITGSTVNFAELFNLTPNQLHYWQVVAMDDQGAETWGPVWEFSTAQ